MMTLMKTQSTASTGHITHVTSFKFCFLLIKFNSIFVYSDMPFWYFCRIRKFDMHFCLSRVSELYSTVERGKRKLYSIYENTVPETGDPSGWRAQRHGEV